jgi:ribosomal protein L29
MNNELLNKSNEELCSLVLQLKLKLLENRFLRSKNQVKNTNEPKEVRTTIARILTILNTRNIRVTIGTHGILMYDKVNNTVTNINDKANSAIKNGNKASSDVSTSVAKSLPADHKVDLNDKAPRARRAFNKVNLVRKSSGGGK